LKLLAHTSDQADVISKLDGVAATYIDLARRLAAEQESPAQAQANERAAEPVGV
jgi:hypothetical protein